MKNTELADQVLKAQIDLFAKGENLVNSIAKIEFIQDPNDDRPCWNWSLRNRILMANQGSFDSRNTSEWKKYGRLPISRTKTIRILKPNMAYLHKVDHGFIRKNGKSYKCSTCNTTFQSLSLGLAEKNIESFVRGYGIAPQYDISNTYQYQKGEKTLVDYTPKKLPKLFAIAKVMNIVVKYQTDPTISSYGHVRSNDNNMVLGTENPKTFYHELSHKVDQKVNLNGKLKSGQDPKQEIVAELSASVLEKMYEIESTNKFSFDYISMYAEKQKITIDKAINQILPRVEKILKFILNEADKLEIKMEIQN